MHYDPLQTRNRTNRYGYSDYTRPNYCDLNPQIPYSLADAHIGEDEKVDVFVIHGQSDSNGCDFDEPALRNRLGNRINSVCIESLQREDAPSDQFDIQYYPKTNRVIAKRREDNLVILDKVIQSTVEQKNSETTLHEIEQTEDNLQLDYSQVSDLSTDSDGFEEASLETQRNLIIKVEQKTSETTSHEIEQTADNLQLDYSQVSDLTSGSDGFEKTSLETQRNLIINEISTLKTNIQMKSGGRRTTWFSKEKVDKLDAIVQWLQQDENKERFNPSQVLGVVRDICASHRHYTLFGGFGETHSSREFNNWFENTYQQQFPGATLLTTRSKYGNLSDVKNNMLLLENQSEANSDGDLPDDGVSLSQGVCGA